MVNLKRRMIYFSVLLCIMTLSACSKKEYGEKENPAGIGQTMYYDGTEANKEKNRFKAEITLEDVVRGEPAQDIFAAAGGYADYHEPLELDEQEELMVARFTFTLTDVQAVRNIDLGDRDVSLFSLISESGTSYDYFQQRSYIKGNLFENAEVGTTQTGALFYIVDKEDENPTIVFLPSVKDGIWFKTSLNEKEKEKVEKPLLAADWLDADGEIINEAGTLNTPLPIGEFGYMKRRSSYFGEYEIEIRVNDLFRGEEAEDQLYDLNVYGIEDRRLLENEEYMLINLTANLPSANFLNDELLIIDSFDFGFINSKDGTTYDNEDVLYLRPHDLCGIAPGGTATGWIGLIIDKSDDAPMMYYRSLDEKMLYFKLDKAYDLPDGFSSYESSPVFQEKPIRDVKQQKGHWKNPYDMGDTVDLNYNPRQDEIFASPFSGNICVKEAYRGEQAEKLIDPTYYWTEPNMDLVVLRIAVQVNEINGDNAPEFTAHSLTLLNGQGAQVIAEAQSAESFKEDGIEKVYPGGVAEGYIAFLVPQSIESLVMTYGDAFTGIDNNAWLSIEFSDSIPEDTADVIEL